MVGGRSGWPSFGGAFPIGTSRSWDEGQGVEASLRCALRSPWEKTWNFQKHPVFGLVWTLQRGQIVFARHYRLQYTPSVHSRIDKFPTNKGVPPFTALNLLCGLALGIVESCHSAGESRWGTAASHLVESHWFVGGELQTAVWVSMCVSFHLLWKLWEHDEIIWNIGVCNSLFIPDCCDCACVMWTYSSSMRDTPE